MKIWHHSNLEPDTESLLQAEGVKYERAYSTVVPEQVNFLSLDIAESDPAWPRLSQRVKKEGGFVWTEFTSQEIWDAEWLMLHATHSIGYPVPNKASWSDLYIQARCATCGVGWQQIAPFRVKKEPHMGRNAFASFWGAFELLCTPEVLDALKAEGIRGYEEWPLLLQKTGEPSQLLKQLIIPNITLPALAEEAAETERFRKNICSTCGKTWYSFYVRGMMPLRREALLHDVDFQLTYEWFGSGRAARHEILVSRRVARMIVQKNWKGIALSPVQIL
jgi:hypothetical protein